MLGTCLSIAIWSLKWTIFELNKKQVPYKKVIQLALLGFSAGVPLLLIFSTLSLWLNEAGVSKAAVTYFALAALGYSFKFVWAPIVDSLPLPFLSRALGRRRGWLLSAQLAVICCILWMASIDPVTGLAAMAFASIALGFSSATQDIVIDSYRIEYAGPDEQAILSSSYFAGYRTGMIVAGAGALYLADFWGSNPNNYLYAAWQKAYWAMALVMCTGVITTLMVPEPKKRAHEHSYPYSSLTYIRFFMLFLLSVTTLVCTLILLPNLEFGDAHFSKVLSFVYKAVEMLCALAAAISIGLLGAKTGLADSKMVSENYIAPVKDFFLRHGSLAIWLLLLVGFYRVSDIVMGVIANLFYQDMGYSKSEIASVTKVFGVLMTISGGFIGGLLALRIGVMRLLLAGAILSAITNIAFIWLSISEPTMQRLALVIACDNLSAGLAVAAFLAWLASLTSIAFTATQYAIFSSIMTLFPKLFGGYSGTIVEQLGYSYFFLLTALIGMPVIVLIVFLQKKLQKL